MDDVLTYGAFFESLSKCNLAVNFKFSVQEYNARSAVYITKAIRDLKDGVVPTIKDHHIVLIFERGKKRVICPIDIADRVIQKVLCDDVLLPAIKPSLIYDNGASLKGKGVSFSSERFEGFLEKAKRQYGADNVWAFVFDFKHFFESIPHQVCL